MFLIILFVILRITSNSFSSVFQKKLCKDLSSNLINFISYLLLGFFCLFLIKFFKIDTIQILYYTLITGFLGAIGNAFQIKALKCGELSTLAPINSYKIIFSLIFSFFILKEIPSKEAFLGIFLIAAGTFVLLKEKNSTPFKNKDVLYRIFAVLFMALEAIFIKKLILLSNSITALFLWAVSSSLFSLIFFIFNKNFNFNIKLNLKSIKYLLLLSITMGIMQLSTNILFSKMNVSYALCLFQLSSIFSVFLGYKIFREKNLFKKLIASTIMIFGSVLIILNI